MKDGVSIQGGATPPVPTPVMGGGSALRIGWNPMPSVTILDSLKGCLFLRLGRMGNMEIKMVRLSEIVPYKNNPRKNAAAVEPVKQSIKEFGFKVPMILDRDNVIVTGHTRFKAAQELGMKEVPVIYADDLTEAQIRAFRLADNKTNEFAEWDENLLRLELDDLSDIDMSLFGFEMSEDSEGGGEPLHRGDENSSV